MSAAAGPAALESHANLDDLPADWDPLFEAGPDVQSSRAWFAASATAALPEGAKPWFVAVRLGGAPTALIPMQAGPGRQWRSLTTPYTCLFQPLFVPSASPDLVRMAAAAFGRHCRQWPATVLEAMDPAWPGLAPFRAGLRDAGLLSRSFAHFGNWHERVAGGWTNYLETRPGSLRATIKRKTRAAERDASLRLESVRGPEALQPALLAYEAVYARSWKEPEPYGNFNGTLVSRLAEAGALRFGVLWAGDQPIAAQYWTVSRGRATVLKLAHDDAFKPVSPGTVLTAYMIRGLLERDGVAEIDFGRGDDAYKQGWARERRERIGLLALDPRRPAGAAGLLRHDAGKIYRSVQLFLRRTAP